MVQDTIWSKDSEDGTDPELCPNDGGDCGNTASVEDRLLEGEIGNRHSGFSRTQSKSVSVRQLHPEETAAVSLLGVECLVDLLRRVDLRCLFVDLLGGLGGWRG